MENENNSVKFTVSYNQSNSTMTVSFLNEDNTIDIPCNMYLPFVSVLIKAGAEFQKKYKVDLGMSRFSAFAEEEHA